MKKSIGLFLTVLLCWSCCVFPAWADGGLSNFQHVRSYTEGQFRDVSSQDWYSACVATVYELGLMDGVSETEFGTGTELTLTQVIAIAARLHRIYTSGQDDFKEGRVWYDVYVRYALEQGIISSRFGCKKTATRAQFADIFSRALPAEALEEINLVEDGAIPHVSMDSEGAAGIYALYRAGIITGGDERGTFYPEEGVTQVEAAAVTARMIDPSQRKSITLTYAGPDLTVGSVQDDSFFAETAILGNSLVDGLRLYSKLQSVDYYCATSVTVVSAMNSKTETLSNGSRVTLVESLCQHQYDKIYIELGINEIGYDVSVFAEMYGEMIDAIAASQEDADIYIMSLLPVTKSRASSSGTVFTMERVNLYNQALRELAAEKECYYLDVCSAFVDASGYLPEEWAVDGVHLKPEYYAVWEERIRTYYA